MSYGWFSESTLAPKKAKVLQVPKGSISVLNKIISKHISVPSSVKATSNRRRSKDPFEQRNPGVELRNRVDKVAQSSGSQRIRERLEEKAKLYDLIARGQVSELPEGTDCLVNFESKREVDSALCTVQEENRTFLVAKDPGPTTCMAEDAKVNDQPLDDISAFSDED